MAAGSLTSHLMTQHGRVEETRRIWRTRAADFPNYISGKGRPAELPGGGMLGRSGDEDGNAGALPAPACI